MLLGVLILGSVVLVSRLIGGSSDSEQLLAPVPTSAPVVTVPRSTTTVAFPTADDTEGLQPTVPLSPVDIAAIEALTRQFIPAIYAGDRANLERTATPALALGFRDEAPLEDGGNSTSAGVTYTANVLSVSPPTREGAALEVQSFVQLAGSDQSSTSLQMRLRVVPTNLGWRVAGING